ncbi:MAG: DUF4198 domain-containing protein, partial [Terriglobales bacterium]
PMGLRLELIAEPDRSPAPGNALRSYRLLYDGRPLADALVTATRPGTADDELRVRSDGEGRVGLRLSAAGMWRIAAVHMVKPPESVAADWESLWASLTFEIPWPASESTRAAGGMHNAACRNKIVASAIQAQR